MILLLVFVSVVQSANVTLFENARFKGASLNLTMEYKDRDCINFPQNWLNRVSSANTGNLCVELHSEANCGGKKIVLYPSTHHFDMAMWIFDKAARSIRVCDQVIDDNHLENRFSILVRVRNSTTITSINEYHVNVFSCETLPAFFRNQMQSIVTYQTCFRYFANANCTGNEIKLPQNHIVGDKLRLSAVVSIGRCGHFNMATTPNPTTVTSQAPIPTTVWSLNGTKTESQNSENAESSNCNGMSHFMVFSVISGTLLIISVLVYAAFYKFKKNTNSEFSWRTISFTTD